MSAGEVVVGTDGGLLEIVLDRAPTRNALRAVDMHRITDAVTDAVDGGAVRAVLIRSVGPHFSAGADIVSVNASGTERPVTGGLIRAVRAGANRMIQTLWDCPLPLVVAVQGRAMGLGAHLALTADVIVAGESASFVEPFAGLGFAVDSGGTWLLARRAGLGAATQVLLRGKPLDARRGHELGVFDEVVADGDLAVQAARITSDLAAGPTLALSVTKGLLRRGLTTDLAAALESELVAVELTVRSSDFKEGIAAFGQRRKPEFTGR
ncbi:enoyl-CoA hydratase/isomerase family protein [Frankia sp. Cr2]|uniref:enoyl-CoA hydratase/isomerase family protein n=1 Tax=Frankia sp. Cr2 TaxID=3073932 RepID=UPI002AD3DB69|nr:enoyl-CoA hydratase-related protein [Frankia sp. Cr2]